MDSAIVLITLIGVLSIIISIFNFPGQVLLLLNLFVWGMLVGFDKVSVYVFVIFIILTLIATFADNIAIAIGAKKFGGSKYAVIGAFAGSILGLFLFFPIGIILFPFIFAFAFDFAKTNDYKKSLQVAYGAIIGLFAGYISKLVITIGLFTWLMFLVW